MNPNRRFLRAGAVRAAAWLLAALVLASGIPAAGAAPPTQETLRLTYDRSAEGRITESASEQEWTFTGQAGDVVLIDMRANDGGSLDTLLTLLDPSGNTLMTDDDSGEGLNSRIGPYPLEQSGEFTIIAAGYTGSGSYTLAVKNLNTIPTLALDKPLVGMVNAEHPTDYFKLEAPASGAPPLVRLEISDDNVYDDPFVSVYGPAGFVAGTEQAEQSFLDPLALISGNVYVAVVSWNPVGSGSAYELALRESPLGLMEDGVPQTGELDYSTFNRQHYFIAQGGDTIRVSVQVEGDIAPALTVSGADLGLRLFSNEGEYVRELTVQLTVPQSGVYVVEVADGTFQGESGSYTVQLDWLAE